MKKSWLTFGLFVLLLVATLSLAQPACFAEQSDQTFSVSPSLYAMPSGANFSVIWITDTQYLSESYPTYYDSLCRWIVNHAEQYKLKMVIHTGDIIEDEGNRTQWENANRSMSILLDADVPYCWNAGNHDYNSTCWIGDQYHAFNPEVLEYKPYWIGDVVDGQNTAVQFSVDNWTFLVLNIEYEASSEVLDWANNLLDSYPESHAIVGAHSYLNTTAGYSVRGTAAAKWPLDFKANVLDTHGNVFLTLSAHHHPASGSRTKVGDRDELMFNRQDDNEQLGAASLRILSFDLVAGKIYVQTYVLYANYFLDDQNNQFTLTTQFYNYDLPVEEPDFTDFWAVAVLGAVVFIVVVVLILVYRRFRRS
ncbi:MAG: metallophosphoesterase [Candidatus Bathyarchaeia archaeon]